jgi:hypothetical protein
MTASDAQNKDTRAISPVVAEIYGAWLSREQRLDEHKKLVRAAVAAYAAGTGPDPTALMAQLAELREDCNSICASLVYTVRRLKEEKG